MQPSALAAYKDPIPAHAVREPSQAGGDRTLAIGDWTVASRTTHIMSAAQIDELRPLARSLVGRGAWGGSTSCAHDPTPHRPRELTRSCLLA